MVKPCSHTAPAPCQVMLAERCEAGEHTVWRCCCNARAPSCMAIVHEACASQRDGAKHLLTRRCCERLGDCAFCEQEREAQARLQAQEDAMRECAALWQLLVQMPRATLLACV